MNKHRKSLRTWTAVLTLALTLAMTLVWVSPGFAEANAWGRMKNVGKFMEKAQKNLQKQSDLRFKDLEDALWAIGSIAKMKGLGIINGYDGDVFRPNSAVKQAEALAMIVRALDMEDEAQELAKRFGGTYATFGYEHDDDELEFEFDPDDFEDVEDVEEMLKKLGERLRERSRKANGQYLPYVPANTQWALGYILLAIDQGWVKISEMNPNASASRAWVSMVMVRALGEEEAAQDEMDSVLPYRDFNSIPDSMVGYVAVAVDLGLFEGYPDGKFQPNKAVTRAEMATIIERYLNEELPEETSYSVKGTITALPSGKITVKAESGRSTTYVISPDALVLVNNKAVSASHLEVGDKVEVLTNGEGVALLITVKEQSTVTTSVTGQIVSIATPAAITLEIEDESNRSITLASNCKITYGTKTLTFSDLRIGDTVQATIQNKLATVLKVTSRGAASEVVTGVITGITTPAAITLAIEGKPNRTITLASNCAITYGSRTLAVSALRLGDTAQVTIKNNLATIVKVTSRGAASQVVKGIIKSITVRSTGVDVVIAKVYGEVTLRLDEDIVITYRTSSLDPEDLRTGDKVEATVQNQKATQILITARNQSIEFGNAGGTIVSISQSGSDYIVTVEDDDTITTFSVASDCVVSYGSTELSRSGLRLGDEIRAELDDDDVAVEIRISARAS